MYDKYLDDTLLCTETSTIVFLRARFPVVLWTHVECDILPTRFLSHIAVSCEVDKVFFIGIRASEWNKPGVHCSSPIKIDRR
jgi:hypothetical protein